MTDFTSILLSKFQEADPAAFGKIQVEKVGATYFISGDLYTAIEDVEEVFQAAVIELDPHGYVASTVRTPKNGLAVTEVSRASSSTSWTATRAGVLDEVSVLHLGFLDIKLVTANPHYKRTNFETFQKVKNIVKVLKTFAPIIVDKNFQVIDGNLRLEVANILEMKSVPVMVLDCEGDKANFLRLVLNRSSEFQRWIYGDVDALVDKLPQAQHLLEPLGFFSNNILPTTFFGNTVIEYEIDEFNEQMKQYSQDIGLAEWAKMRKAEILAEEEERKRKKNSKLQTDGRVSLFDLSVSDDDFIEVNDPKEAIEAHVEHMKAVADGITNSYDEKRKAEKEAKGQAWQTSRRTSKKKAADLRAAAEADALDGDLKGTEDE